MQVVALKAHAPAQQAHQQESAVQSNVPLLCSEKAWSAGGRTLLGHAVQQPHKAELRQPA